MNKYGTAIKEARTERNLSMGDVEKATKISTANQSRWEQGQSIPSIYHCELLADFYGISLDELIGRDLHFPANGDRYTQNNVNGNNNMSIKNFHK